jgi:hypothetical protein
MYDRMCLQFKDCIDAIQALYLEFDTVWHFNHSCSHDHGRGDGLPVGNMRVNWGGKQSRARDTEIEGRDWVPWPTLIVIKGWRHPKNDFSGGGCRALLYVTNKL